jgi:hypothetical protein
MGAETEIAASGGAELIISFVVIGVFYVALFSWLTMIDWARQRRMEREAYYRHETEKKLIETGEQSAELILSLRKEVEYARWLQRREGLKLGGLITTAIGVGIFAALRFIDTGGFSVEAIGLVPLAIGIVLLLYSYALYPRLTDQRGDRDRLPPGNERHGADSLRGGPGGTNTGQ